jgi:multicomponent Na+:H+ antiporter subunit F
MHTPVYYVTVIWLSILFAILVVRALRASGTLDRLLAVDTLALVAVGALAVVCFHHQEPAYLDAALVLALLAFVQAVAVTLYVLRGTMLPAGEVPAAADEAPAPRGEARR